MLPWLLVLCAAASACAPPDGWSVAPPECEGADSASFVRGFGASPLAGSPPRGLFGEPSGRYAVTSGTWPTVAPSPQGTGTTAPPDQSFSTGNFRGATTSSTTNARAAAPAAPR